MQSKFDQLSKKFDINSFNTNTPKYSTQIINNINNQQELIAVNGGRYVGQVVNGLPEGKGIDYYNNGDRYEGDFRNDKQEGKGIYYYNNGNRMMGDYYNNKPIGKHVTLTRNGEVKINNY